jgi:EmrB/QacA subfamily drug resistance transporter
MPTIVAQLGGLSIYSWVFAIYMLASTTTVPIYGKLSDLYGRKKVYAFAMVLFLIGSVLCGTATSMHQLIFYRAVQGLGAGGVLPLALIIIGELFSVEQRARMQGLFSGVWGVSSVIGPLIGGFLVDQISWQWVFYINLIPGALAIILVWFAWQDSAKVSRKKVQLDILGAVFLTLGVLFLLLGLNELGKPLGWWFLSASVGLFIGLYYAEKKAVDPILPLRLFRERLFIVAILHGVLAGWAMFGSLSYVPLFVQAVLGTSATIAGVTLTPMSLSWTLASIYGGRMVLKMSYRSVALIGMVLLLVGSFFMITISTETSQLAIMVYTSLMGIGMGLSIPVFLISIQTAVKTKELGIATSTVQFSRSLGGTIGVSVLGIFLSTRLVTLLIKNGIDPATISLNNLINPPPGANTTVEGPLRVILGTTMANMFIIAFVASFLALIAVLFTPKGRIAQLKPVSTIEEESLELVS